MLQSLPTYAEMLRHSQRLPEALRGRSIVLLFDQPVRDTTLEHFYRIHLTGSMLAGGEEQFLTPEVVQPHRVRPKCPICQQRMRRVGVVSFRCETPWCTEDGRPSRLRTRIAGPLRGVVKVRTDFDAPMGERIVNVSFVAGAEPIKTRGRVRQANLVKGCLLMLDRRYHDVVLCAVYRTAGGICDQLGIRLL